MQQDNTIPQVQPEFTPNYPGGQKPDNEFKQPEKKGRHLIKQFLSNFGIIIAAPIIALLLIGFVFQSYEVEGQSMQNTLQDKDRLVVLKIGKTLASLKNEDYIPDRYSIIIFHKADSFEGSADRQLVKRVIALPGERVTVRNGTVTVYNQEHPKGFNPDSKSDYEDNIEGLTPGNLDITVKSGEIFVLGDNRNNSSDSRVFGTVSSDQVVGELALRIYPFSSFESF